MEYWIAAGILLLLVLHILLLLQLRNMQQKTDGTETEKLMKRLLDEENRLQQAQAEHMNETIRLSMEMVNGSLSQNQAQTRDTTAAQLKQFEERIRGLEAANARAMSMLRDTLEGQLELLRAHNDKRLAEIRKTVDENLQEQLETRMNESFKRVTESLEAVYKGLGEMKTLASDVGGLKRVLSNVKTRGTLGEIRLGSILQEILAPEQYAENVETVAGSGKRVEFAIRLPREDSGCIWLPIDSKFPADCYAQLLDAQESGDRAAVDRASAALRQRLLGFAKDIRDKYLHEPETTAFGILFLPFEGLYSEVVSSGITEELQQKYSVSVAGPSTMAALLNALYMGLRTLAVQKQSDQVWEILGGVKTEFEKFERVLSSTQKKLDDAGKELDQLVGVRTRAINQKLRQIGTAALPDGETERSADSIRT